MTRCVLLLSTAVFLLLAGLCPILLADEYTDDFNDGVIAPWWACSTSSSIWFRFYEFGGVLAMSGHGGGGGAGAASVRSPVFPCQSFECSVDFQCGSDQTAGLSVISGSTEFYLDYEQQYYATGVRNQYGYSSRQSAFGDEDTIWHTFRLVYDHVTWMCQAYVDDTFLNSASVGLVNFRIQISGSWGGNWGSMKFDNFRFVYAGTPDLIDRGEAYRGVSMAEICQDLAGQVIEVSCDISNVGNGPSSPCAVRFYASTDTVINTWDHLIGETRIPGIQPGGWTRCLWRGDLPTDIPAGEYNVGWVIDPNGEIYETEKANNSAFNESQKLSVRICRPTLTISSGIGGSVTSPGEGVYSYEYGSTVPVEARPDPGYRFIRWTGSAVEANRVADPFAPATSVLAVGQQTLRAEFALARPVYVDVDAKGLNNGSNWQNAYSSLQDALADTNQMPKPVEVWVAQGTYTPDQGRGLMKGDVTATFQLVNGVTIRGGYAGLGERDPDRRDIQAYETILSGDLMRNDIRVTDPCCLLSAPNWRVDNSWHVVKGMETDNTAVLSGVTITGGQYMFRGGGIYLKQTSSILKSCTFRANKAANGGAVAVLGGDPCFVACTFAENAAEYFGGAVHVEDGNPTFADCILTQNVATKGAGMDNCSVSGITNPMLRRCQFIRNIATGQGGAMYNYGMSAKSRATLIECTFTGNSAYQGGAVFNDYGEPTVSSCTFRNNLATEGAGMFSAMASTPVVANSRFLQNQAREHGGGLFNQGCVVQLANCTYSGNVAGWRGGGIFNVDSRLSLGNCILWGDIARDCPEIYSNDPMNVTGSYCNVQGGPFSLTPADSFNTKIPIGNMDVNPDLTPDGHITSSSPCIDAGNNDAVLAYGSVSEPVPYDIDREPRFIDNPFTSDTGSGREPIVDIGADEFLDSDGDGLPDWWGKRYFNGADADPNGDYDHDSLTNLEEYEVYGSNPTARPFYVNVNNSDDLLANGSPDHAFATIQDGLNAASDGDTVIVARGTYKGLGNGGLDFNGKSIVLVGIDGPEATIIDCEYRNRGFYFHSGEGPGAAVVGFTIVGGRADHGGAIRCECSSPQIRECVVTDCNDPEGYAGGVYGYTSFPTFADCTIGSNGSRSVWLEYGGATILGTVKLARDEWSGQNVMFTGSGTLELHGDATLTLKDSRLRCRLRGPGLVEVPLASELAIEGTADVNLVGEHGNGRIRCDGLLRVRDCAQIRNAHILVTRVSFENDAIISNSVIMAQAGSPYGQFFVEDTVKISGNDIHADGDRYMDLDPSTFKGIVENNRIYVTVTEGQNNTLGGLLELRGRDLHKTACAPDQFACQVLDIPDFNTTTWTIERLELAHDAKVNLTNRFDFGNGHLSEVMYVKQLVLGDNAVLNTAFNRIYYGHIEPSDATKQIVNVPILGFSLNNIAFDNADEFSTRITHNSYQHPEHPTYDRPHVQRIADHEPDAAGMMEMRALKDRDPESGSYGLSLSARAKGVFSKASEDRILVKFEYLFETDEPGTELVVYLSDVPELQEPRDPNHYVEVGRVRPPRHGRPGSVGSGCFGTFHRYVNRRHLNFIRGTRVELELIGPDGTIVLINNWDPQIQCPQMCMDFDGSNYIDYLDLMPAIGELGRRAELDERGGNECVDAFLSCDGFVDVFDVPGWEWAIDNQALDLCPQTQEDEDRALPLTGGDLASSMSTLASLRRNIASQMSPVDGGLELQALLVAGKPRWRKHDDGCVYSSDLKPQNLYVLDDKGECQNLLGLGTDRRVGRLARGLDSEIYMTCVGAGVFRVLQGGGTELVFSSDHTYSIATEPRYGRGAQVRVGLQLDGVQAYGRPIWDVAVGSDALYVIPVVVAPDGRAPYLAAAKLTSSTMHSSGYEISRLYDDPSFFDMNATDNPHLGGLREIEVDDQGNVYVLNAHSRNRSDTLWKYPPVGKLQRIELMGSKSRVQIPDPIGLCVSSKREMVYVASGQIDDSNPSSTVVYGFSTDDLTLKRSVRIQGMHQVSGITEDPASGDLWVVGFTMEVSRLWDPGSYNEVTESFYNARLARIRWSDQESVESTYITGSHDLALPLSIVWTGP